LNGSLDMKAELDTDKKLEQIRQVAKLLNVPGTIEKGMQKLARDEKDLFRQLSHTPLSAGHFYELDIIELSQFTTFLGGLAMHLNNEIELPQNVIEDLRDHKDEFPDWIDLEDVDNLKANLLAAYYTLNRSLHAINTVGKPINQLLEEGISRNDRGPLKQAVKFDPVAISSPQISSMLMLSEMQGNKNLKRGLCGDQLDMERGTAWIHADESKSRKAFMVPLNNDALNVLHRVRGTHPVYVFTYQGKPVARTTTKAWYAACKRAGIESFRWHDLRHTWASWHVQSGTSSQELMELGGWSCIEMVLRYAHLGGEHLRRASKRIEGTKLTQNVSVAKLRLVVSN